MIPIISVGVAKDQGGRRAGRRRRLKGLITTSGNTVLKGKSPYWTGEKAKRVKLMRKSVSPKLNRLKRRCAEIEKRET